MGIPIDRANAPGHVDSSAEPSQQRSVSFGAQHAAQPDAPVRADGTHPTAWERRVAELDAGLAAFGIHIGTVELSGWEASAPPSPTLPMSLENSDDDSTLVGRNWRDDASEIDFIDDEPDRAASEPASDTTSLSGTEGSVHDATGAEHCGAATLDPLR